MQLILYIIFYNIIVVIFKTTKERIIVHQFSAQSRVKLLWWFWKRKFEKEVIAQEQGIITSKALLYKNVNDVTGLRIIRILLKIRILINDQGAILFFKQITFLIDNFIKYLFIYFERKSPVFHFYRYIELYISGSLEVFWLALIFCIQPIIRVLSPISKFTHVAYCK
jgi:hypothetical protein